MRILAVDDEKLMLSALVSAINEAMPEAEVAAFRSGSSALEYFEDNKIDVAFLDIRMRGMDGLELARKLLEMDPSLNIIFCTGYDEYISEAFREIRCNGYITKPVDADTVRKELAHLRTPIAAEDVGKTGKGGLAGGFETAEVGAGAGGTACAGADAGSVAAGTDSVAAGAGASGSSVNGRHRVRFQCFGYFAAYIDDEPIKFSSAKTLELLAYLVNAGGGTVTNQEILTYLWDDDEEHESYLKKLRKDLIETLTAYGCEDILVRQWGGMSLRTDKVDCDYYDWKKNNPGKYEGDYMKQYYWTVY